jgi:Cu-Zn family superoxide dismutase
MFGSKRVRRAVLAIGLVGLLAGVVVSSTSVDASGDSESHRRSAEATLRNADGDRVGDVHLIQRRGAVAVFADVQGLESGFHGFHVHATGVCEAPFTSAGGHFNPGDTTHGDHAGDLPSLLVMKNGTASLFFETDRFTLSDLFDEDGSAIIVHAGSDNYANIPDRYHSHEEDVFGPDSATLGAGDAGARVACGVVER